MGEFSRQQHMQLRMMNALVLPGQKIAEERSAHHVEQGVCKLSGGHSAASTNSSVVEGDGMGKGVSTPALVLEGSSVQAEAGGVGCDGGDGQVSEAPDRPAPSAAAGDHVRGT